MSNIREALFDLHAQGAPYSVPRDDRVRLRYIVKGLTIEFWRFWFSAAYKLADSISKKIIGMSIRSRISQYEMKKKIEKYQQGDIYCNERKEESS